ncbi:polymorphic toxin-type HINT domain-containing protein [Actinoalloteichus caeruleus]|uniref:Pretoxin HINT domain-containing protein n=1 Tax=Actinoalloteichus caeruleus DSM 43889 TaxID=1120930 RepID=A0ABT1JFN5_ACTCY|nr:polymorphic toxin-type HINT domain-containing protein [Actinoalloteichus caeruleus]MCP2331296.1 Pretoxin HINT domain-containing protein [Actinoalloteichus caeruleus DSM 43889]
MSTTARAPQPSHEHPFWIDNHDHWTHATDLTRADTLLTPTGDHTAITHAHTYPHHHRAHNLTINATHTYYVYWPAPRRSSSTIPEGRARK